MARDDAGEGREDAPWDFDLPDLGAAATPEHHRRRRPRGASEPSSSRDPGTESRRPADEPTDIGAPDADPIDQDDDLLVPPSAAELSTHGPGRRGPALPDEVADDHGGDASPRAAGARSPRRPAEPEDDLLPAWATGRSARRGTPSDGRGRSDGRAPGTRHPSARGASSGAASAWEDDLDDIPRERRPRRAPGREPDGGPRTAAPAGAADRPDDRDDLDGRGAGGRRPYGEHHDYDDYDDHGEDRGYGEQVHGAGRVPLRQRLLADPARITRILVPVALVLLVIALLIMIVNGLTGRGGDEEPESADPAAVAQPSEDPFDGFSARPEDETTDGASGPAARACGDALSLEASTDEQTYPEGEDPVLIMTLENTGEDPCMVNAGTARMDFRVVSGSDTVFDSEHCQIEGQDRPIELEPGETQSAHLQWDRQRSAPGCSGDSEEAAPGGYELDVSLGETSADPVEFTLEGGAEADPEAAPEG